MADIICRWRNGTPKTVVELVNSMPHSIMPAERFRTIMQSSIWGPDFFRTPYQLACQLGLYCEAEDGYFYPRFDHDINEDEAKLYLEFWITRYYVPNPYTGRDGFNNIECPTYVLFELYSYTKSHPNCTYKDAYKAVFREEATNNNDIVKNYINNFSKVLEFDTNGLLNITNINPQSSFDFMERYDKKGFFDSFNKKPAKKRIEKSTINKGYYHFLTALRTKPFMLLAGISGTGKSRIVREMAKACWEEGDPEYGKPHPRNFCMVQVKPNWHDSSELIGYVSRLNGEKFVVGPFLRFLAAALKEPNVPYFLCLDEMNLAPVEQYFAEYLSVIESRKLNDDGTITTDPIIEYENTDTYGSLIDQLFDTPEERKAYKTDGGGKRLTVPQNLFVVGTVNMDETTFSFSRKVLDRAMTIEMNEVDLHGGLEKGTGNEIGYIGNSIIGDSAEGCDVYEDNKELCDQVLAYLEKVNAILKDTPFKIAYRTRNEFLMYAVNRHKLAPDSQLWQTLDEMTSMKILSRIEGDEERTKKVLDGLKALVEEQIKALIPAAEEGKSATQSISATKIDEMLAKLKATGFTSYWA